MKGGPTRWAFQPRIVAGRTPSISAAWAVFKDLVILVRQNFWGLLAILYISMGLIQLLCGREPKG
jgi:hypothetical protein